MWTLQFNKNLSEFAVTSPHEIYQLLKKGQFSRTTASNKLNDLSSRSHAVFIITLDQLIYDDDQVSSVKVSKLNLVDLAGSERIRVTGAKGKQLEESKKINKSLSYIPI